MYTYIHICIYTYICMYIHPPSATSNQTGSFGAGGGQEGRRGMGDPVAGRAQAARPALAPPDACRHAAATHIRGAGFSAAPRAGGHSAGPGRRGRARARRRHHRVGLAARPHGRRELLDAGDCAGHPPAPPPAGPARRRCARFGSAWLPASPLAC